MRLDYEKRIAYLGIGEWSRFSLNPIASFYAPFSRSRLKAGQEWHKKSQAETEAILTPSQIDLKAFFEVTIEGHVPCDQWTLKLNGRIDQIITRNRLHSFVEIKTIQEQLPVPEDELITRYSDYFAQLAMYQSIGQHHPDWNDRPIEATLTFIDIHNETIQSVEISSELSAHLIKERHHRLTPFLQSRTDAHLRLKQLNYRPPFQSLRPGQAETKKGLQRLATQYSKIYFQAPTGYGKTGTILEYALDKLKSGLFDRVIYLTGKSTGQIQVRRQLQQMLSGLEGPHFYQMRNQAEHITAQIIEELFDPQDEANRWESARLDMSSLFQDHTVSLDALFKIAASTGIRPYTLSKAILPFAEVWIGDYNYIFAPASRNIFVDQPDFEPAKTLLIIDEAHNLPSRIESAYSHQWVASDWHSIASELQFTLAPPVVHRATANLAAFLDKIPLSECHELTQFYEGVVHLRELNQALQAHSLPWEDLSTFALDNLRDIPRLLKMLEQNTLSYLSWAQSKGTWTLSCLDASTEIAATLNSFGQAVFLSATLDPITDLQQRLGLSGDPNQGILRAEAPWRDHAYQVAIDTRADTRFKQRQQSIPLTADTIARACIANFKPIAVFFPSYKYAEQVARYVRQLAASLSISIQPSGLDLPAQEQFIEESLLTAHALFLVLGTGFTEGIDLLGGRIDFAIVVGPALPEIDAVNQARLQQSNRATREQAFHSTYQIPGIQKINQALGRLVRAPNQNAKILLHGKRFQDSAYHHLLAPEYQSDHYIRTQSDLESWLYSKQR